VLIEGKLAHYAGSFNQAGSVKRGFGAQKKALLDRRRIGSMRALNVSDVMFEMPL